MEKYHPFLHKIKSDCDVELYIDTQEFSSSTCSKKVYIQLEPFTTYDQSNYLYLNQLKYDAIICYNPTQFSNAISYYPSCTWIEPQYYEAIDMEAKEFQISHICGWKDFTVGHRIRKDIHMNQLKLKDFPITFYRSYVQPHMPDINCNPLIPGETLTEKVVLFTHFQYSIVIENTREKNCFSEKIIDCLITKTIPIYYGCENIHDIFDTTGWIMLETTESTYKELQTKLQHINESYYMKYKDVIEKNYETAKRYSSYSTNLCEALVKLPFIHYV